MASNFIASSKLGWSWVCWRKLSISKIPRVKSQRGLNRSTYRRPIPVTQTGDYAARESSKLTFEKHLRSVSRAASQRLGILRNSWRVFHDRVLFGRCFRGLVLPVLEYCSAVWCSAADTHLKLLYYVVSGACFIAGGVLNCNLSHRRSVAVLCMLYKIRCNRCTHFVALYLCLMCQSGLHAVL